MAEEHVTNWKLPCAVGNERPTFTGIVVVDGVTAGLDVVDPVVVVGGSVKLVHIKFGGFRIAS